MLGYKYNINIIIKCILENLKETEKILRKLEQYCKYLNNC